jgi:hypothetical protein
MSSSLRRGAGRGRGQVASLQASPTLPCAGGLPLRLDGPGTPVTFDEVEHLLGEVDLVTGGWRTPQVGLAGRLERRQRHGADERRPPPSPCTFWKACTALRIAGPAAWGREGHEVGPGRAASPDLGGRSGLGRAIDPWSVPPGGGGSADRPTA